MFGYIYITTNLINDKKYIGKRYGAFDSTYYGSGTILKKAIEKYGLKNFNTVLLKECCNEEDINKSEKILIRVLNPEYNIAEGGAGGNTLLHASDDHKLEVIKKRSISLKKAWDRKDRKKWGKAISEAKKGKRCGGVKAHTDETKLKISKSNKIAAKNRPESWKVNHQIASEKRKGIPNKKCMKPLILDGKKYNSRKEAAKKLGVTGSMITYYIKKGRGRYL